jgi:hypothetical protein
MNRYLLVTLATLCMAVMGGTAHAQDHDAVVAQVPFDFVVGTKTMPAGTYKVALLSDDPHGGLTVSKRDDSAVVLPIVVDEATDPQGSQLDFARVGAQYVLTQVETPNHLYTVSRARANAMLVQVPDRGNVSSGGTK